ncbi:hypothetical protein FLONG3_480 [Fusarium longipes]|uniref:Uncharacterized protein n=1 Tax=Fusarium longipes TaxID=694270 RepID=A0A395TA39_9HYPO|nr:hypothetical protein FLONG3_480 [Fusarium longipes]
MSNQTSEQDSITVALQLQHLQLNVRLTQELDALKTQVRNRFFFQTHHHVQKIPHLVQDWKEEAANKFFENREKSGIARTVPLAEAEFDNYCTAMIQNRETMILNLKLGNVGFEKKIVELQAKPNELLSDLTIERFKTFTEARDKMIVNLEIEKKELVDDYLVRWGY